MPDAICIPVQYGVDPPAEAQDKDAELYIVDFSYKRDVMLSLAAMRRQKMAVLDHHESAQQELAGFEEEVRVHNWAHNWEACEVRFDMTKSGAVLAWEYLHGDTKPCPRLLLYVQDRDLWKFELFMSREVNAYLRTLPFDFKIWSELANLDHVSLVHRCLIPGQTILLREKQIVDQHVRYARPITLAGFQVLAVNATVLFSEIAGELAVGRPFGVCYFDRQDGKRQWSLRSTPEGENVADIARSFGGGGHRHAAGFETTTPDITQGLS
jgi:oligoribonuclease NrnB/cAMP/cGMP phosphodiesterase (DHH superfamily)